MFKKHGTLILTLVLCAVFVALLPIVAKATAVPDFANFTYANYFTADYTVASTAGTASVSGATISLTATGVNGTSGCNSKPAVSSTTTVTLTAKETIEVTCIPGSGITMAPPSAVTTNADGSKTFVVGAGQSVTFSVTASNATQVSGSVTFSAVTSAETKVPSDCATYTYNGTVYNYMDEVLDAAKSSGGIIAVTGDGKVYHSSVETDENYANKSFSYTIPGNVTLLIPFDSSNTLLTNISKNQVLDAYDTTLTSRHQFRKLTMPTGTEITVESGGSINIGSRVGNQFIGQVGYYGAVEMYDNSNITIQSGATLYAYGYVFPVFGEDGKMSESGTVTIESGGTVYEPISIMDYPGSSSSASNITDAGVFPMRSFAIRNVEVPMTLESGAKEYVFTCLYGSNALVGTNPMYVLAIANGNVNGETPIFQNSGTITKYYVNQRMHIESSGNLILNEMKVSLAATLGTVSIKSSDTSGFYIPSCYDMVVKSGTVTLNDNVIMCEGSSLTIDSGATVNTNGKKVYVLDADEDPGAVVKSNGCSIDVQDVHGKYYTNVPKDAVLDINGTLIASGGFYTSSSGACIISSNGTGKIQVSGASNSTTVSVKNTNSYSTINITAAKLKNDDGYFDTANGGARTYKYNSDTGRWECYAENGENPHVEGSDNKCAICGAQLCTHEDVTAFPAVEPICVEGNKAYWHCNECGKNFKNEAYTESFEGDEFKLPAEHSFGGWQIGDTEHWKECTRDNCDAKTSQGQHSDGASDGDHKCDACGKDNISEHSYGQTAHQDATCIAPGYTTYECGDCKHSYSDQLATVDHTSDEAVRENEVAATCTKTGSYDEVVYCAVDGCNEELSRTTKTIDMIAHTPATAVRENEVDATCYAEGSYESVIKCSGCGVEISREQKTIDKIAHTPGEAVEEDRVDSTCHSEGSYNVVIYCTVEGCGAEISSTSQTIAKKDHTPGEAVEEDRVDSTCHSEGSYNVVIYCTVEGCGAEISSTPNTIAKKNHTPGEAVRENEVETTCHTAGSYDEVIYCSVEGCGAEISRTPKTIDKIAHTPGDAVQEKYKAATCYAEGSYDEVVYCSVEACKHEISRTAKTIDKTGHTPASAVRENEVAATCGNAGSHESVIYCSVEACKCEISRETVVVPATGQHLYDNDCDTGCNNCSHAREIQHDYVAVVTPSTCIKGGYTTYTCSVCSDSYTGDETAVSAHTPGKPVVENSTAATCGHTGSYDEVTYCSVCNEKLSSEHKTVDALPHSPSAAVEENRVESTCTVPGSYDSVVKCSVCGDELSRETKELELAAHTPGEAVEEDKVDSTCHSVGSYNVVVYCTVEGCGAKISSTPGTIAKKAHTAGDAVRENEVGTTCHTAGSYDEVIYCSVEGCGAEISRTPKTIDKIAHTLGDAVPENYKAATCYAEGSYEEVVYCAVEACKHEISRTAKTIEKIAHTPGTAVRENEVGATCHTEGSYDEVVYCAVEACKHEISRTAKTIEKIAHTPGTAVRENEVGATCHTEGSYDEVVYCSVEACKHEISRTARTIEKIAHTPGTAVRENEVGATCHTEGSYDEVVYCSVEACKHEISRTAKTIEKIAHTPGTAVRENEVGATCHTEGSYDEVVYCSVEACKHEISRTAKAIEKTAHNPGETKFENRVAATCYKEGSCDEVTYCTVCQAETSRDHKIIPVVAHTKGPAQIENQVPATCYAEGSYDEVFYCVVEGCDGSFISRETKTIEKLEHTHGQAVRENEQAPTCGEDGFYEIVVYCSVENCGAELSRESFVDPATGNHNYTIEVEKKEATCTVDGYMIEKCDTCGDEKTTTLIAPGHSYDNVVVTPPTCEEDGYTTRTCSVCEHSYKDAYQDAIGHTDEGADNVCDTCGKTICEHTWTVNDDAYSWTDDYTCVVVGVASCGKTEHNKTATFNVTEDYIYIDTNPTCTEDGLAYHIAIFTDSWLSPYVNEMGFHAYKEVTIPAVGHKLVQIEAKAPTCTVDGYEAYEYCTACDYTTYVKVPATGHNYTTEVTPPTCTENGYTTHTCAVCSDSYVDTYVDATLAHDYSVKGGDKKETWLVCSACGAKTDTVARTYNVTIVDCWGNTTIRKGYTYGQYLWLNYSTSNVLELKHNGWKVHSKDNDTVAAYEVWESFTIDENTTDLIVYEDSTVDGIKYGAIMMSVSYDQANSEKTMTIDLFIYVDSLDDAHKPIVMFGGQEKTLETIDPSIMMYFVSIDLSAAQITQGGTNVQITVDFDRDGKADKIIDSVLIAYEKALQDYLEENVGDIAGTAQEEAINAVLNYGKAVQLVFGNPEGITFDGYTAEEIAKYAENIEINQDELTNTVNGVTFNWKSASVDFQSEYSIRYKFTMEGLEGYTPDSAQLIVKDKSGKVLHDYTFGYNEEGRTDFVSAEEDGVTYYYVKYPVPAIDLTKEETTVQLKITLKDANGDVKVAESSEFEYGIYAYLKREIYKCTVDGAKFYFDEAQTIDKTPEYVNMLVSLIKLGEAVNKIDAMTSKQ